MDLSGWARVFTAVTPLVSAFVGLFKSTPKEPKPPTEAELRNQRQEQAAGAARNYSSRRTELAEKAKRDKL